MIKGTVIFINEDDLRKNTKELPTIEDRMELIGDELKAYQEADIVIYRDNEVVKNKYGKIGTITRKKI
jgi:guanylate kinase